MKLIGKWIEKDGSGSVSVFCNEGEDLWNLYNLICQGDTIRTTTIRRIQREGNTGSTESERLRLTLTLRIKHTFFDPPSQLLRISGITCVENKFVKLGSFHTIEIEQNKNISIWKHNWDSISLDRLKEATDPTLRADVAALLITEGLANLCLITENMTITKSKIELSIPRKRKGAVDSHDKTLEKFFDLCIASLLRHLDFSLVKCVIVAGPGFTKDQFWTYLSEQAIKKDIKTFNDNKSKFILAHASAAHKHALKEVLGNDSVVGKLTATKAMGETHIFQEFFNTLRTDPDRACYGHNHIFYCHDRLAIHALLISDNLFRSSSVPVRKKFVKLCEEVRANGAQVYIFSTLHVSGEQLNQLGGIAAILRFPIPELEDLEIETAPIEEPVPVETDTTSSSSSAGYAILQPQAQQGAVIHDDVFNMGGDDSGPEKPHFHDNEEDDTEGFI